MRITIHRHHLLAVVLITQFLTNAFAQQPRRPVLEPPPPAQQTIRPESDDVVRITTNLVQVDAVVTDKNGAMVTDLKPEEVQISEDGKQQRITNFSYVTTEALEATRRTSRPTTAEKNAPPVPSARLKREDVRRTIAVVVDDLGLSFESMYLVRRALRKFVDEQIQPGDLVAIIRTSGGIGALQQLTSDKRQLYAAIERVRWVAAGRSGVGAFAPIIRTPVLSMGGDGPPASNDDWTLGEDVDQLREDHFAVGTLGALNYVVKGLRELPGRKSILLLSDGFKLFNRDDPGRSSRVYLAVERLIDQANRAAVVVYTMDAGGLQTLNYTAADSFGGRPDQNAAQLIGRRAEFSDSQSGLSFLADQTGGFAIRNNNDLSGGMRRMLEDQRGYYLIGYRPDESTFDVRTGRRKFHHLSLKVTRPGKFNVRMRNGFYGVSNEDAKPPETPIQRMIGALVSPFGSSDVRLQLTSLFTNDAKTGSLMRSMLHIDARDLTFTDEPDGWHKSVFDILAVTFADNGVPIDQVSRTHTVRVRDQTYQRVLRDGFVYAVAVPVKKGGAYQLRVALRDTDSQRVGSASQFVEIPDLKKNRLELSGIAVNGTTAAEYAGSTPISSSANAASPSTMEKSGESPGEGVDDGDAQASPAVRRFHQGLVMQYGYLIFNAQSNKATRQPQLTTQVRLVRDGKVIFTGNEIPFDPAGQADMKRLVVGGAIQLGTELSPGEYVLQVIVTDALTSEKRRSATQWIDFEIIK
jgi:VWFA-related protein